MRPDHCARLKRFALIVAGVVAVGLTLSAAIGIFASTINSVSPANAIAGSPDLLLTVTATDFDAATVWVEWNGAALTDFGVLDPATLTATVPASLLAAAGTATLVLIDAVNGASEPFTFTIENPVPVLAAVDPGSAVAGEPFTLTLTGAGFVSDTLVTLDSTPLAVVEQTTTTLVALAPSNTFTMPGVYPLAISNAAPGGGSASTPFTITQAPLASLVVEPAVATLSIMASRPFTATGADAFGNAVTPLVVTWSINPGDESAGSLVAIGDYTATFRAGSSPGFYPGALIARAGDLTATADITVLPGTLARIVIEPPGVTLAVVATQAFTASGFDASGNPVVPFAVTWSLAPSMTGNLESAGGVTVTLRAGTVAGLYPSSLTARAGGISATADITVLAGALAQIMLQPPSASLAIGGRRIFLASGVDAHGNAKQVANVAWSMTPTIGVLASTGPLTVEFEAGTRAGAFGSAMRARLGNVEGVADVTIRPDPPSVLDLRAAPGNLSTDGLSRSVVTVTVMDRYANRVAAGAPVTLSVTCQGVCAVTPRSGTTTAGGLFTTTVTSTLRAVTRTITSTIRVTALVSPAITAHGFATNVVTLSGYFVPRRTRLPFLGYRYPPPNNHSLCTAMAVVPPVTIDQSAYDTFNVYRFHGTTPSLDFTLRNYPASGSMFLHRITADRCATSGAMSIALIAQTPIITPPATFVWPVRNQFVPGVEYVLTVYNLSNKSQRLYTLTFTPRALAASAIAPSTPIAPLTFSAQQLAELKAFGIDLKLTAGPHRPPLRERRMERR